MVYYVIEVMSHLIQPMYYRFREKTGYKLQLIKWKLLAFDVIKNVWVTIDKR